MFHFEFRRATNCSFPPGLADVQLPTTTCFLGSGMIVHKDMHVLAPWCPTCGRVPLYRGHDCSGGCKHVKEPCPRCGRTITSREHRDHCDLCPLCENCCTQLRSEAPKPETGADTGFRVSPEGIKHLSALTQFHDVPTEALIRIVKYKTKLKVTNRWAAIALLVSNPCPIPVPTNSAT